MKDLKDNGYLLNTSLSKNIYRKFHEHGLINNYVLEDDGRIFNDTIEKIDINKKEKKFILIFGDIYMR